MNKSLLKNAIIMATMVLFVPMAAAQVTIGSTQTPDATLHVMAPTVPTGVPIGIIAPQISIADLNDLSGDYVHGADQHGAIIFVTNAGVAADRVGRTELITEAGYYWFDAPAERWRPFGGGAVAGGDRVTSVITHHADLSGPAALTLTVNAADIETEVVTIIFTADPLLGTGQTMTINLPNLSAADAGQVVHIRVQRNGSHVNISGAGALGHITAHAGATFVWCGASWFRIG